MDYFTQMYESTAERSEPEPSTLPNVLNPHQNTLLLLIGMVQPELMTTDVVVYFAETEAMSIPADAQNEYFTQNNSLSTHNECDGPFGCCFPNKPS
jgi:7-cyano-7-deazaguanine synthase in queuosine biosynthesis